MDNWGQGTFTLCVSRLYRRAVCISGVEVIPFSCFSPLVSFQFGDMQVVGFHILVHFVEVYVGQKWTYYTSYKVANMLVEFSTSIPRTQLRPGYGDGFLGAPLQMGPALEHPTPREQGEQRGSSTTPSQQTPGGAPHV